MSPTVPNPMKDLPKSALLLSGWVSSVGVCVCVLQSSGVKKIDVCIDELSLMFCEAFLQAKIQLK